MLRGVHTQRRLGVATALGWVIPDHKTQAVGITQNPHTPSDYNNLLRRCNHCFGRGLCGGAMQIFAPSPLWW
jgi:hypothetical protein|eukprot:COSAG01_NODE_11133_length_1999_cov_2.274211_2_plen_72_part_00